MSNFGPITPGRHADDTERTRKIVEASEKRERARVKNWHVHDEAIINDDGNFSVAIRADQYGGTNEVALVHGENLEHAEENAQRIVKAMLGVDTDTYYILSGEGTGQGQWAVADLTDDEITARLEEERCNGDRWAKAVHSVSEVVDFGWKGIDHETGNEVILPDWLIRGED